jgi:hypothetical protein
LSFFTKNWLTTKWTLRLFSDEQRMFFCFTRESEPITYKTTSPRREMHVVSVCVWRDGASTWRAREKNRQRRLRNGARWTHAPRPWPVT